MRIRRYSRQCALIFVLLLPADAAGMNLMHYSLDSLVYLSTDIVLADISKDTQGNFTATVTESLYGSLQPGVKLDALTPFLTFFQPMDDGQRVILFLDRRPHQYDFLHQDAAKSPFAVPPSGVYLIDEYGHVHEYFQPNNPGPYVAQGYMFVPEHTVPTEKDDLALPSLDEVKAQIAATVKSVIPIRDFLDRPMTAGDVPALMKLLTSRPRVPEMCSVGMNDAIASDVVEKIRSLNDPELLLRIWHLDGGVVSAPAFVQGNDFTADVEKSFTAARVKFLIQTLEDRKKDVSLRIASSEILFDLAGFHSHPIPGPSRVLPIDNDWLASSADEIVATAKAIFNNPAEDSDLRALSLQFLDLHNPNDVADIRRVYRHTHSSKLQFAIEQAFLEMSDELYESLHPSSGPIASIVQLAPEHGCVQPPDNQITFITRFYSTRAFATAKNGFIVPEGHIMLSNPKTGQSVDLKNVRSMGGYWSTLDGALIFALGQLSDFPAGVYTLGMEYRHDDASEVQSVGHTMTVAITDTPDGKRLSIPPADKKDR